MNMSQLKYNGRKKSVIRRPIIIFKLNELLLELPSNPFLKEKCVELLTIQKMSGKNVYNIMKYKDLLEYVPR